MKPRNRFGVAFSGGGYRAATYHIGTLRALNDLSVLSKIDVLATNSGGSITGAYFTLCMKDGSFNYDFFEKTLLLCLQKNTILKALFYPSVLLGLFSIFGLIGLSYLVAIRLSIWLSVGLILCTVFLIIRYQFVLIPLSKGIENAYRKIFFKNALLENLPNHPKLVMNATNVETGKLWSFSKDKMDDYTYRFEFKPGIEFISGRFPIARSVAASTCVPFAFSPVSIDKSFYLDGNDYRRIKPKLVDGGVYDNQGISKLIQENSSYNCDIVLVSDSGAGMSFNSNQRNVFSLLIRMMDIFMLRIKNLQMISGVYENKTSKTKQREIGYFSLGWDPRQIVSSFITHFKEGNLMPASVTFQRLNGRENDSYEILESHIKANLKWSELTFPTEHELVIAQSISTNLWPLSKDQTNALIKHSYVMTLIFMQLYCPSILKKSDTNYI